MKKYLVTNDPCHVGEEYEDLKFFRAHAVDTVESNETGNVRYVETFNYDTHTHFKHHINKDAVERVLEHIQTVGGEDFGQSCYMEICKDINTDEYIMLYVSNTWHSTDCIAVVSKDSIETLLIANKIIG